MNKKSVLFVTNHIGRGLVSLSRALTRHGYNVAIASGQSSNAKYLVGVKYFQIPRFKLFKREYLFGNKTLNDYINQNQPIIHTLDDVAANAMRDYKHINHPLNIGIDLDVFNPNAITIPRTTQVLNEYNVAPHQKMITVISPLCEKLPNLLAALSKLDRDDYIIASLGTTTRTHAKKISDMIAQNNLAGRIILVGDEPDLPSLFRASYAIMSLGNDDPRLLKSAVALGRMTIWPTNEFEIDANIPLADFEPDTIAKTIETAIDTSAAKRDVFEDTNLSHASEFDIQKTVKECLTLYKK